MKKITAVSFLFVALFYWVAQAKASDQFQIERPVWKVGYTWVFEEKIDGKLAGRQTTKVVEANEDGYITETIFNAEDGKVTKGRVSYNKDLNIVKIITIGVKGSQEFYPQDQRFFWEMKPGEENVKFYRFADDRGRVRQGDVKAIITVFLADKEKIRILRILTGRDNQSWQERDEIIFSLEKKWIEYRKIEARGHVSEVRLVEFKEK